MNLLCELPLEVAELILDFMDVVSLCKMREVCHKWRDLVDNLEHMWRSTCCRYCTLEDVENTRKHGYSWQVSFFSIIKLNCS